MFGWFKRKPGELDELLAQVEDDVVRLVPAAVRAMAVPGPAYGVFLYYDDYSGGFDDLGLQVVVAAHAVRERTLLLRGREYASRAVWVPVIELGRYSGFVISRTLEDPDFVRLYKAVYLLQLKDATPNDDPDTFLTPIQQALRRACRRLNARDWRGELTPADDFAVVPGESHGVFTDEDVRQSLPADKLKLLESRRLLFHDPTDAERAAERRTIETVAEQMAGVPVAQRIAFWLKQLLALADDKPNRLTERGWSVAFALERVSEYGPAAAGPLIDLVTALDRRPARDAGGPTLAADIARAALAAVGELRPAEAAAERKLRDLLADSVRQNQGRDQWDEMPYRIAQTVERLFHGYGWATADFNNVLQDAGMFLSAPLGNRPKD